MSNELLASKVVVVEEEPRLGNIAALPTAILGAIGIAERGPVAQPVLVTSFEEFIATFGGFTPNSDLALAASAFFENGGRVMWVVRTVHFGNTTDLATKGSRAASLVLKDRAAAPLDTLRIDGKWDGAYANDIRIVIAPATSGAASELNLSVQDNGLVAEVFTNLSMDPAKPRYIEAVINGLDRGSRLIAATDLSSTAVSPGQLPALGTFGPLTGGDDGLANLADTDFTGTAAGKTGLHALDAIQALTLLIVPGRATAAVHNAMLTYCEVTRDRGCFAILDCPANQSALGVITYAETTAAILGASELGALYWPRVKILNPSKTVFGNTPDLTVPASGHIAGVYARTDGARPGGVFVPPAGTQNGQLFGVIGFETDEVLDEAKRDLVFPKRINPLTVYPGTPRHIDGARTLKGDGNFPTVAERRGVIFIEQSLKFGLLFAKHQNNTEALRAALTRTVTAFLLIQLKNGAFASTNPKKAYFVDFGEALNPPSSIDAGQVLGRIGLATAKPAEFIVLRFSQDTRAIDAELAADRQIEEDEMPIIGTPRTFFKKFSFVVQCDGVDSAGFQKASELSAEVASIEYFEGGSLIPNKSPGRLKFSDVTLERGATKDQNLFDWFSEVADAASNAGLVEPRFKRTVDVVQLDRDGSTLRRWSLSGAWPVKFVAGAWDNEADENVIESVTLTYDFFTLA